MTRITLATLALAMPFAAAASPESYTLDPHHTHPNFMVEHLGVSMMYGRFFKSGGKFVIDRAAKKGSVEVNVETASVDMGDNDKGSRARSLNDHLKNADFFNVAEFPRMTYKSGNLRFSGDVPSEIEGQLTLLGVSKPVTLKLDRWVCKDNPMSKKPMCGGNASGSIRRSDFGMKYALGAVGDEIKLMIQFEGYRD